MLSWINALISFLGTALGIVKFKSELKKFRAKKEQEQVRQAITSYTKLYDRLKNLAVELKADRVVLLRASNGGSLPSLTTPMYSWVHAEEGRPHKAALQPTWDGQRLDKEYIYLLNRIFSTYKSEGKNTGEILVTKDMPDCILKDTYLIDGVASAKIMPIFISSRALWYLSISFSTIIESTPESREILRLNILAIRNLFDSVHSELVEKNRTSMYL